MQPSFRWPHRSFSRLNSLSCVGLYVRDQHGPIPAGGSPVPATQDPGSTKNVQIELRLHRKLPRSAKKERPRDGSCRPSLSSSPSGTGAGLVGAWALDSMHLVDGKSKCVSFRPTVGSTCCRSAQTVLRSAAAGGVHDTFSSHVRSVRTSSTHHIHHGGTLGRFMASFRRHRLSAPPPRVTRLSGGPRWCPVARICAIREPNRPGSRSWVLWRPLICIVPVRRPQPADHHFGHPAMFGRARLLEPGARGRGGCVRGMRPLLAALPTLHT